MFQMVTHKKLKVLRFHNLKTLKNSENLPRSLKFVIHHNLDHSSFKHGSKLKYLNSDQLLPS